MVQATLNPSLGSNLLDQLAEIATQAASIVLEVYQGDFAVELKGPDDPVTTADRRANEMICRALYDTFPGCPVVAEESEASAYGDYRNAERVFFVDPVDGTREFVRKTGEFVIMIGCVQDERAVAGVILAPTTSTLWAGEQGLGAWRRKDGETSFTPIAPASTTELSASRLLVSRSQTRTEIEGLRNRLRLPEVEAMGSAGLKGAAVADGSADGYVTQDYAGKRWDACAPDAIVSAAGGVFTDALGQPIDYRSQDLVNRQGLVAANAALHQDIVRMLVADRR